MQRPLSLFDELNMMVLILRHRPLRLLVSKHDLSGLEFDGCDHRSKRIDGAKLIGTDLSGATGISLEPGRCQLRGTRISMDTAVATLEAQGLIIG